MKRLMKYVAALLVVAIPLSCTAALACTGVYVGKEASDQGTIIIARSEDQAWGDVNKRYTVQERVENVPGRYLEDKETGFRLPLPETTYKYTYTPDYTEGGGMYPATCTNEYGVSITATVSTSPSEQFAEADPFVDAGIAEAIMAISVAAVSTTAREGVDTLLGYIDTYGSSQGNTVMINDQTEAWLVEIYGGHSYCAVRMPDDAVAVFGNQNMIGLVDPAATPEDGYIYSDGLFELLDDTGLAVKEGEYYHLARSVDNNHRSDANNMRNWIGMSLLAPSLAESYESGAFYPLFYQPDEKVSVLDLMELYRNRLEGTPLDVTLPGQEGNRVIGTQKSSQIHLIQTFPDWPASCSAITWLCLGNAEHSVFLPTFSGITDTAAAYQVDGDTYDGNGAFWKCKRICTLAEQDREVYSKGVREFWRQQESLMYQEMLDAAPIMLEQYSISRKAGEAYVTQLGKDMAERTFLYADNLYAKLLTGLIHNTGLGREPVTFLADAPLRHVAESRGYTVIWDQATQSVTMVKGDTSYTVTLGSDICRTGDGEEIVLTHYCYASNGITYLPMDFIETL